MMVGMDRVATARPTGISSKRYRSDFSSRVFELPSFCGKDYYGLKVHEGVLNRGVKVTGATVHFVDDGTDTGPIILQKAVEVHQDDTPKSLQLRVMEEEEWVIMPRAIDLIGNGKVIVEGGKALIEQ